MVEEIFFLAFPNQVKLSRWLKKNGLKLLLRWTRPFLIQFIDKESNAFSSLSNLFPLTRLHVSLHFVVLLMKKICLENKVWMELRKQISENFISSLFEMKMQWFRICNTMPVYILFWCSLTFLMSLSSFCEKSFDISIYGYRLLDSLPKV